MDDNELTTKNLEKWLTQLWQNFAIRPTYVRFRGANVSNKCTIWYDPKLDGYTLQCAFSPNFIEFIKAAIPASDRSFDPATKNWKFHKKYADAVLKTAKSMFGDSNVAFISEAQVRGATPQVSKNLTIDQTFAEFMKLLPFDAANAAFRKAAMLLHPDRGGNMDSMSRLNTLWDRIRTEFYKEV
jgi:hypothetical protein